MSCTHVLLEYTHSHAEAADFGTICMVRRQKLLLFRTQSRVKKKNTQFILFLQTWAELSFHPCPFILLPHVVIHVFPYPWWHLWLTGWCSPYLDEKRKNRTVKMHTSPCILQRGHAAAVLASVPVFAQMRWQASCGNYTPAALESIGTCALISWIKWEFVLTFLETLHW